MIRGHSEIDNLVSRCRYQSGSYPAQTTPYPIEGLIKGFYDLIRHGRPEIEINALIYKEVTGFDLLAIYFNFHMSVPYKGKVYPVMCKMTFPPNFPNVPPIFSVVNNDESRLQMNKAYINFVLPDRSFEVKLTSSVYWKSSFSAQMLFNEFSTCLSTNFPFFQTTNPLRNPNQNYYYDPRYNDPAVIFPFDYNDIPVTNNTPSYVTPNGHTSNPFSTPNSHFGNQATFFPSEQQKPGYATQAGYGLGNTSSPVRQSPASGYHRTNTASNEVQTKAIADIEMDLKTICENLEYLAEKKEDLTILENKVKEKEKSLDEEVKKLAQKNIELRKMQDDRRTKDISMETIDSFVEFSSPAEYSLTKVVCDLRGLQKTQVFLEDSFFERDFCTYEQVVQRLGTLWRKEFDNKLALSLLQ